MRNNIRLLKVIFSCFVFALLFFTSCSKEELRNVEEEKQHAEIRDYIINEYHFDADKVLLDGDEFVAGCVFFPIDNFWEKYTLSEQGEDSLLTPENEGDITNRRHYRSTHKVPPGTYKVRLAWNLPWNIKNSTRNAIAAWNALNLDVKFVETNFNNQHIYVSYVSFNCPNDYYSQAGQLNERYATAELPWSWLWVKRPGRNIRVNSSNCAGLANQSWFVRKHVMMHELGHAIGFRHTDGWAGGQLFANGCNGADFSSIMRERVPNNTGAKFSNCDQKIFKAYY